MPLVISGGISLAHGYFLFQLFRFTQLSSICTGISWVSEASSIAADLRLQADIKGTRDRLLQLDRLRLDRGEIGPRRPREMAEETMVVRFQEPQLEILQGHLEELTRVLRCEAQ